MNEQINPNINNVIDCLNKIVDDGRIVKIRFQPRNGADPESDLEKKFNKILDENGMDDQRILSFKTEPIYNCRPIRDRNGKIIGYDCT